MTIEEKNLLIRDLCSRLPYGVKFPVTVKDPITLEPFETIGTMSCINEYGIVSFDWDYKGQEILVKDSLHIKDVRPYLFPLSSMSEEQKNDCPIGETNLNIINSNIGYGIIEMPWRLSFLFIDWCNKNNFDYRGLIPMGLANNATGLNIY